MSDTYKSISLHNVYPVVRGDEITEVIAEYVWLGGKQELRSKCRTLTNTPDRMLQVEDLPDWNYDGSSCYQAQTEMSEIIMKPVAVFKDPFRGRAAGNRHHLLVFCDAYLWEDPGTFKKLRPVNTNFRAHSKPIFD